MYYASADKGVFIIVVLVVVVGSTIVMYYGQTAYRRSPRTSLESVVNRMKHSQSVVCMIHTTPDSWMTRARAVRHTWGPRCTTSIYFYASSAAGPNHEIRKAPNTVGLDVAHGREHLTAKTRAGLKYAYDKYGNTSDWFMKADDDVYLIWENLIILLNELQPQNTTGGGEQPLYLGRHFVTILPKGYTSGGAGYLVNKPAARLLIDGPEKNPAQCHRDGGFEDVEMGRCLASFNVYPANTYDEEGKLRFHCGTPLKVFSGSDPLYYIEMAGAKFGTPKHKPRDQMLSEKAISFHYITPEQILMFDYLLYHLKVGDTQHPK